MSAANLAAQCDACEGCQHRNVRGPDAETAAQPQWCYMFEKAPSQLPCGQHNRYAVERKITGALLKKYPVLFGAFVINNS